MAGALLSFALSIDDFVITQFVAGQTVTCPLYVYGAVKTSILPQVFVLGTIIFFGGALIAVSTLFSSRRTTREGTVEQKAKTADLAREAAV